MSDLRDFELYQPKNKLCSKSVRIGYKTSHITRVAEITESELLNLFTTEIPGTNNAFALMDNISEKDYYKWKPAVLEETKNKDNWEIIYIAEEKNTEQKNHREVPSPTCIRWLKVLLKNKKNNTYLFRTITNVKIETKYRTSHNSGWYIDPSSMHSDRTFWEAVKTIVSADGSPTVESVAADLATIVSADGTPTAESVAADLATILGVYGPPTAESVVADLTNILGAYGSPTSASVAADLANDLGADGPPTSASVAADLKNIFGANGSLTAASIVADLANVLRVLANIL